MTAIPELRSLARLVPGEPRVALRRLLILVCEQLGMDFAFASVLSGDDRRTIRISVQADGSPVPGGAGLSDPLSDTWCGRVIAEGAVIVNDARERADLWALPITRALDIASYAGVALRDASGAAVGTLCAVGHEPHGTLNSRDREVLLGLAEVVAPLLLALDDAAVIPRQRSAPDLSAVADAVGSARDVEGLSRPLLDALHDLTGLASSYLTVIHEERDVQEIRYSRNTRPGFSLPEGLIVPWGDTLCRRALEEGRPCTTDVPGVWSDSQAGIDLGIQVYVSVPVSLADGRVWGTLCAADSQRADEVEQHLPTMRLFARLIAAQVEQEAAVERERARAEEARAEAETDALTRCSTRRTVEPWLRRNLAVSGPDDVVLALYVDVDDFKCVNDGLGHAAGDAVLAEIGRRLHGAAQPNDLVARLGGDEFLVAARLPRTTAASVVDRYRRELDFSMIWEDEPLQVRASLGWVISDGHGAAELVAAADREMYLDKRSRLSAAAR